MSYYQREGGDFNNFAKPEDDDKKLFVGGLSWETNKDDLKKYFEQFGEVTYCALKTDPHTNKSRGFGFITFADEGSVLKVVQTKEHNLDNRTIDPKRARSRSNPEYGPPVKKIFVGGVDPTKLTEEAIRDYFGQFGSITDFSHPYDKIKKQKKGFCFISFDKADNVHNIVGNATSSKHTIDGKQVDVRKAIEQQQQGGYQDSWGQQGWGGNQNGWGYQQQGSWGQSGQGRGDYQSRGGGWGNDQSYGSSGNYGGGSYGQSGYGSYGSGQSGNYYQQGGYGGNGYGYE